MLCWAGLFFLSGRARSNKTRYAVVIGACLKVKECHQRMRAMMRRESSAFLVRCLSELDQNGPVLSAEGVCSSSLPSLPCYPPTNQQL